MLSIAGVAGALLFLPAITFLGHLLSPSPLTAAEAHAPPLLGHAIWARTLGGRATELRPLEPFGIARMVSCHVLAARFGDQAERDWQHDQCMSLMPAVQGIAYLSSVQMRSDGVWQTPRVPFIQIAMVNQVTHAWTRAQLIDTLAERGEFGFGWQGVTAAAQGYFAKPANDLTLPQAAMIAAFIGDRRTDPWCDPAATAAMRRRILERMRDNLFIDDAAMQAANIAELGLAAPPGTHKPCAQ